VSGFVRCMYSLLSFFLPFNMYMCNFMYKNRLYHHCVVIFFWSSGIMECTYVCCLHLKMEFCSCARGRQWCGIIHCRWWTASIKPRLLFSRAGYASWGLSLSSVWCCLLQLLFSACVAAVKSRPVLHHCVVIFFWSSGIMECTCMLFTFENGVLLMR